MKASLTSRLNRLYNLRISSARPRSRVRRTHGRATAAEEAWEKEGGVRSQLNCAGLN
jgi:hypothetical protein